MEYPKIINLLDNKYRESTIETEINDDKRGTYVTNSQVKIKTPTLK